MKYLLRYSKTVEKDISKMPPQIRKRVGKKIAYFCSQDDPVAFAEKLTKSSTAQYRWRVGVYRVLFDFDGINIDILRIRHRKNVYKK